MSEAEEVGSVGEEAWKLLRALTASDQESTASDAEGAHACPTGWCPICQVVGLVREHPEALARVGASAAALLQSLRDLATTPEDPR